MQKAKQKTKQKKKKKLTQNKTIKEQKNQQSLDWDRYVLGGVTGVGLVHIPIHFIYFILFYFFAF